MTLVKVLLSEMSETELHTMQNVFWIILGSCMDDEKHAWYNLLYQLTLEERFFRKALHGPR